MIDGYSSADLDPFELVVTTFVNGCELLCDGNFCSDDGCGGTCGTCDEGLECNSENFKCYPVNCTAQCDTRECGQDGCGGVSTIAIFRGLAS
jgi:hypothetical protein